MSIKKSSLNRTIYGDLECNLQLSYEPQKLARLYIIRSLSYCRVTMVEGWEEVVTCSEIFNAFLKNNFNPNSTFNVGNCSFSFQLINNVPKLRMKLTIDSDLYPGEDEEFDQDIVVDFQRANVSIIYGVLSRIINRCDLNDIFD